MERVNGVDIKPHFCRIEDKPISFYSDFQIIVLGLDSVEARSYINSVACGFLGLSFLLMLFKQVAWAALAVQIIFWVVYLNAYALCPFFYKSFWLSSSRLLDFFCLIVQPLIPSLLSSCCWSWNNVGEWEGCKWYFFVKCKTTFFLSLMNKMESHSFYRGTSDP